MPKITKHNKKIFLYKLTLKLTSLCEMKQKHEENMHNEDCFLQVCDKRNQ